MDTETCFSPTQYGGRRPLELYHKASGIHVVVSAMQETNFAQLLLLLLAAASCHTGGFPVGLVGSQPIQGTKTFFAYTGHWCRDCIHGCYWPKHLGGPGRRASQGV